jgi:hypothetical protein
VLGPEVTSPFDFLTLLWYRLAVEIFRLSLTVLSVVRLFQLPLKMPAENLREGIVPPENIFFLGDPQGTSLSQSARNEV